MNVEKNEHFEWDDFEDDDELDKQVIDNRTEVDNDKEQKQVVSDQDDDDSDWSSSEQSDTDKKKIKPSIPNKSKDDNFNRFVMKNRAKSRKWS